MTARQRPRGFSLVELLVVIGIIGVLVAILLPALHHAQGGGRRTQCRDYLKQLGFALHNYHDTHKTLPPGIAVGDDPAGVLPCDFLAASATCDRPEIARVSGLTMLLPFFEEKAAYDQYNRRLACCAAENATSVSTVSKILLCPNNPRSFDEPLPWGYYVAPAAARLPGPAPTDYVFNAGAVALPTCGAAALPTQFARAAGPFGINRSVDFGDFKDGLTSTILMGESAGGKALRPGANRFGRAPAGEEPIVGPLRSGVCDQAWSQGYFGTRDGRGGFGSVFAATAFNAWHRPDGTLAPHGQWTALPINEGIPTQAVRSTWRKPAPPAFAEAADGSAFSGHDGGMQGFRSHHPKIAQMVWGDGSVRVLAESASVELAVALSTHAGRETVDVPTAE